MRLETLSSLYIDGAFPSFCSLGEMNEFCLPACSLLGLAWWWVSVPFCAWCDAIFFLESSTPQMWVFKAFAFPCSAAAGAPLNFQMLSIILTAPKKWTSYFNTSPKRSFISSLMKYSLDTFISSTSLLARKVYTKQCEHILCSCIEECLQSNKRDFVCKWNL